MNKLISFDPSWLKFYILPLLLLGGLFSEINLTISGGEIPLRVSAGDFVILCAILVYVYVSRLNLVKIAVDNVCIVSIGLLFIAISLLTSVINNDLWLISLKFCIKFCALFLLLALIYQDALVSRKTLSALFLIVIFINLIGILEYFLYDEIKEFLLLFKSKESLYGHKYALAGSVFPNPNPYGVFNAVFIIAMLSLTFGYRLLVNRYLLGLTLFLSMAGVILSSSRDALLTLVVGTVLLLAALMKENKNGKKIFIALILICCLMLFSALKFNKTFAYKVGSAIPAATKIFEGERIGLDDIVPKYNQGARIQIWKAGIGLIKEKPIFGTGAGQFQYRNGIDFGGKISNSFNMHNFFGEMLVNHGIVGLSLILILIAAWFKKAKMRWQLVVIITLLASHIFDCFITYNILWLIFIPWVVAITTKDPAQMFSVD